MAFIVASGKRPASGGGGGGDTTTWAYEVVDVSSPYTAGTYTKPLGFTPVSENAINVWSEGQQLKKGDDWTTQVISGVTHVRILHEIDPTLSVDGTNWRFAFQYPYSI